MAGLGGKKRHELMQKLFSNESEEDETKSNHESSQYLDEGDGGQEHGIGKDEYGEKEVTSKRKDNAADVGSEKSDNFHAENENENGEEVNLARSPSDEMLFEKLVLDNEENQQHKSKNQKRKKKKGKAVGAPLELEIPLCPPPTLPHQMYMMKDSNIIGFDPKPFDPETYVEQDEAAGSSRNRAPLSNNIIRWREVKNPDGTTSIESNARFVQWSDGSVQLMIGNETLDTHVQDTELDQAHLFLRHGQGILQSQGRLQRKLSVTPSSLSSNSHQQLVSRVSSRNRKVHKVKRFITNVDPEKEKEQKQTAESQVIRTNTLLNCRKAKVNGKYMPTSRGERQHSPGFLENSLNEEEEPNYYESQRSAQLRFKEDLEIEAQRRKRLIIAKKDIPKKSYVSATEPSKCEEEEEEYGAYEYEDEEEENENVENEEDAEHQNPKKKASADLKEIESDEDSPQRKITTHRQMAIIFDSDEE